MNLFEIRYYFSKDDLLVLLKILEIPVGLIVVVLLLWAGGEVKEYLANPTLEHLRQLAEKELLPGTDKAAVISFLDRNQIGHGIYEPVTEKERQLSMEFDNDKIKENLSRVHNRINGGRDVSNWRWIFGCLMTIWVYFDEEGKLVDYQLHGLCDG